MKDPEIMLFGKKIHLPEKAVHAVGGEYSGEPSDESKSNNNHKKMKRSEHPSEVSRGDHQETADDGDQKHDKDDEDRTSGSETITDQEDADQIQSLPEQSSKAIISASSEEHNPSSENQPTKKNLKKPDKILPCPRCNSKDTKFCYYNNYNINQPRHFCKSCQRYWTAGGTMRHIPAGAGRRKNKNSVGHFRRFTISEALHYRINNDPFSDYNHPQTEFKTKGTVLSFRSDPSTSPNGYVRKGCYNINSGGSFSCENKEEKGVHNIDCSNRTSSVVLQQNANGLIPTSQVPFGSGFMCPFSGIFYPAYPIPVYQNWNSWPVNANSSLFDNSRSGELLREKSASDRKEESSLVIPKTLRIDDPKEAAKSSIWTTLGIKYDDVKREELFKSLQPKKDYKKLTMRTTSSSTSLQTNPAALSRSIRFQESV